MCDFSVSERLVAWMDRELPDNEAADVERHVRECSECRGRVDAYEQVSRAFVAYCDATMEKKTRRRMKRWMPLLASAAAAAVLLLVLQPAAVKQTPRVAEAAPAVVVETETETAKGTETDGGAGTGSTAPPESKSES